MDKNKNPEKHVTPNEITISKISTKQSLKNKFISRFKLNFGAREKT